MASCLPSLPPRHFQQDLSLGPSTRGCISVRGGSGGLHFFFLFLLCVFLFFLLILFCFAFCDCFFCVFFCVLCSENGKGKPLSEFFFLWHTVVFEARALLYARLEFCELILCEPWCPVWWAHGSRAPKHEKWRAFTFTNTAKSQRAELQRGKSGAKLWAGEGKNSDILGRLVEGGSGGGGGRGPAAPRMNKTSNQKHHTLSHTQTQPSVG